MARPHGTTGSLKPTFVPARAVALAVRRPSAYTLVVRLPTALRAPSRASGTLWEATAPVKLPACHGPRRCDRPSEVVSKARVVFHWCLRASRNRRLNGSHLCYAGYTDNQWQVVVKVHGVFLSCRGKSESSPILLFRRAYGGDSSQVVTPFVQVGTYPTRNFATLGPL
jgi:hypothetical protein